MQQTSSAVRLPHAGPVAPWNNGRFVGPKPPFKPKQVWAIRLLLQRGNRDRDLALFDLAIDSKLRGCGVVRLRIGDVAVGGAPRHRATVVQQKTGRPVQFQLTGQTRESVVAWLVRRGVGPDDRLFPSRSRRGAHLSSRQHARLVDEWVEAIGLSQSAYETHSLRRTEVTVIDKRTGDLRDVPILLGHTKVESTVRNLGVDTEDALALSEATEI